MLWHNSTLPLILLACPPSVLNQKSKHRPEASGLYLLLGTRSPRESGSLSTEGRKKVHLNKAIPIALVLQQHVVPPLQVLFLVGLDVPWEGRSLTLDILFIGSGLG